MSVVFPVESSAVTPHTKYERLIAAAKDVPSAVTVVVHPCDEASLTGVCEAAEIGIIKPILVGPINRIKGTAAKHDLNIENFEIVDAQHSEEAAAKGVALVHEAKGELLMKGSLHTDELMGAEFRDNPAFGRRAGSATASSWMCRAIPRR
jgi:phosphate acetyltransferase